MGSAPARAPLRLVLLRHGAAGAPPGQLWAKRVPLAQLSDISDNVAACCAVKLGREQRGARGVAHAAAGVRLERLRELARHGHNVRLRGHGKVAKHRVHKGSGV